MTRPAESIHRDNVHLRRIRPTDADTLHRIINESLTHLRPWMNWVPQTGPHPRAAVDEFLTRTRENWSAGTSYTYLVTVSGQPVGVCGLEQRIGPDGLEIGYWLHPDHTGHGYITTAAAALTDQAFTLPGITRVQIWTDEANTASARVPQRLGFTEIARRTPARDPLTPAESGTDVIWELTRST
ncbi:GNAT family N-acetyltransferase [Nocardia transvalensis]|nr:GNAT family N-acetyltransferase [Nocardia transvalensis]